MVECWGRLRLLRAEIATTRIRTPITPSGMRRQDFFVLGNFEDIVFSMVKQ